MSRSTSEQNTIVVDKPVAQFKRRASTAGEIQRAKAMLEENLPRVRGLEWVVEIAFDDGEAYRVDCPSGRLRRAGADDPPVDGTIAIPAADFLHVASGRMDARTMMRYGRMQNTGSPKAVTKFLDSLGGRQLVGSLTIDPALLPRPTTDYEAAKADFRKFGYCFIKDALPPTQLRAVRQRLEEQAQAEREIGYACRATGTKSGVPPIQPVWNLVNKGQVFMELLEHPLIDEFGVEFLGEYFQVSSFTSKIAHPGNQPQYMHNDQGGVHPPLPNVMLGLNVFFYIDDFTEANGATRVYPGSHLPENGVAPDSILSTDGSIPAEAPAGTALVFETRLYHGTGANKTQADRRALFILLTRSWVRTIENHTLSVRPEVLARMSDRLKTLHGFRTTGSAGGVDGPVEGEFVDRDFASRIGELHPRGVG
jgi:ectoine hydroxylase-related dioxygenase (phytanoyl-CoA dioxygenase family)